MNLKQFNGKYKDYLEKDSESESGYSPGCTIEAADVLDAIDHIFSEAIKIDKNFRYSEISRSKSGIFRIFTSNDRLWERKIEEYLSQMVGRPSIPTLKE